MSEPQEKVITDNVPSTMKRINLSSIRENKTALRGCDRNQVDYKELLESVKKHGVLESITVRECKDPETNTMYYGLINGLQRFTAAKDAGLTEIDAKVIVATDFEVLQKQIILNVQRIVTKPAEYSQALSRMLVMNPAMTIHELASIVGKSVNWLYDRLSLLDLKENIAKLVDENKISLPNAYALAKLPAEEQDAFVDRAINQTVQEFVPQTTARIKEINDAKRKGKTPGPAVFTPAPHQRKLEELKAEYERPSIGATIIKTKGITDPVAAFQEGINWACCMDDASIAQAKAKDEARKKEAADAKARRDEERAANNKTAGVNKVFGV